MTGQATAQLHCRLRTAPLCSGLSAGRRIAVSAVKSNQEQRVKSDWDQDGGAFPRGWKVLETGRDTIAFDWWSEASFSIADRSWAV